DADLAVVDLATGTPPLALAPHRMRAALGTTAGIKGDDAIGFAEPIADLFHQHLAQRAMIPGRGAHEGLQAQALDIDQRPDVPGILAWPRGQEPCQGKMHMALSGCGLKSLLIG